MSNKVPYNLFAKWHKDTRKKIIPIQVFGTSPKEVDSVETSVPVLNQNPIGDYPAHLYPELHIWVDICMNNDVYVSLKNLSYEGL